MILAPSATIRRARVDEVGVLNALTGRSALSWGYESEFLDWEPESILVTAEFITDSPVFVLEQAGTVVGYYGLLGEPPEISLDKLFVAPEWIGTGRGKYLWEHAVQTARALGATTITLASDPNAAPFYRAMGAQWEQAITTSRPGWLLQLFRYPIPAMSLTPMTHEETS